MSIEAISIGQQLSAMDRRLESSVNTTLRTTAVTLQTAEQETHPEREQPSTDENVERFVEQMQSLSNMFDRKLQFQVNRELERVIIKVIDSNTDKIIREIPSAEIQKLQLRIKEALGLLFDESI